MTPCRFQWLIALACLLAASSLHAESFFVSTEAYEDLNEDFQSRRKLIFLPKVIEASPTIDGKLDDACWTDAFHFDGFVQVESGLPIPSDIDTEGFVVRGADGLFIAIRGKRKSLPPAWKDRSGTVDADDPAVADHGLDWLAIQFNPNLTDFTRKRFAVGKDSKTYALKDFTIPAWKPEGWSAKYHATDETITGEFFIPWNLLRDETPNDGDRLAFNVIRYAGQLVPVPGGPYRYGVGEEYVWSSNLSHSISCVDQFPWICLTSREAYEQTQRPPVLRVYLDRVVYRNVDEAGEGFIECRYGSTPFSLRIALRDAAGKTVHEHVIDKPVSTDAGFTFRPAILAPGQYTIHVSAQHEDKTLSEASRAMTVEQTKTPKTKLPKEIKLVLTDHADIGTGIYPISTGIVMPRGMLFDKDLPRLGLERQVPSDEDPKRPWLSKWEPVDAQFGVRNRWYRDGSIKWLSVDFDAVYYRGRQQSAYRMDHPYYPTYRVVFDAEPREIADPLSVEQTDEAITINTGPMKAVVSKKAFGLISGAWLDQNDDGKFTESEQLIDDRGGLIHIDDQDQIFRGAGKVWVEQAGPMKAVVVAEGWHMRGDERKGRHQTRLFFHRGHADIKVHHTYIVTVDTRHEAIRNVGVHVGIPGVQSYTFSDQTGGARHGKVEGKVYQLHLKHNQYVIEKEIADAQIGELVEEGGRSGGWMTAHSPRGQVQLIARRLWQLYPKELEIGPDGMALHVWPKHGRKVFTDEEINDPLHVAQALFAHHGRDLSIRLPDSCYETMGKAFSDAAKAKGHDKLIAPRIAGFQFNYAYEAWHANGQGMAFTTEMLLRLMPPGDDDVAAQHAAAKAFQADPHATADPKWTYESRVFGELWPEDKARFGSVEQAIRERHQLVFVDQCDRLGDYGAINWPDFHQYPDSYLTGRFGATWFHRTWTGTHYQEGRTMYLLYLRSGDHAYWTYARDGARHKMDVSTVNYASSPRVGKDQTPWGNYHVYGVFGWSGSQGISCHYQNVDYKAWEYFLTGDRRGYDQALNWAKEMARATWATESTRDAAVTCSEAIEVYNATRYAPLLKTIHWFKEACVATPIEKFILPHYSQMAYHRIHHDTRDPRAAERLLEHWGDGNTKKRYGLGSNITRLLMYRLTGDKRILHTMSFQPPRGGALVPGLQPPSVSRTMMNAPYTMSGLVEVNAPGDTLTDRGAHQRFWQDDVEQWKQEGKSLWGEAFR